MFKNILKISNYKLLGKQTNNSFVINNFVIAKKYASIKVAKPVQKNPTEFLKWVLLVFPVGSFGLGCWQTYRLQWKLELIDILKSKTNAEPIDLPKSLENLNEMEYRPVKVRGEFLHEKEFFIGPRALIEDSGFGGKRGSLITDPKKNQGWLVITPFKLADTGEVILINRGWIPSHLRSQESRAASMIKGNVELVGVVRLTEKRYQFMPKNNPAKGMWNNRDLDQMSRHFNCEPVWLDAKGIPDPPEGWPIPNQTRATLRNEHLGYLVTWFTLCAFTSLMWHRYFYKKLPLI